jgi:hypothetical protein
LSKKSDISTQITDEHLSTLLCIAMSTFTPHIRKLDSSCKQHHDTLIWQVSVMSSQDNSADTATGYALDDLGSIPSMARFSSSPQCSDQLWDPPSLLQWVLRAIFPGDKVTRP